MVNLSDVHLNKDLTVYYRFKIFHIKLDFKPIIGSINYKGFLSTRGVRKQNDILLFSALYEHYSPMVDNIVIIKLTTAYLLMVVSKGFEIYQKNLRGYPLYFTIENNAR